MAQQEMDFYTLRHEAGLTKSAAADLFGVDVKTIANWDRHNKPPRAVFLYLELLTGHLGHLGPDWSGFRIRDNCIESPEGEFVYAWEVRAMRYLLACAGLSHSSLFKILKLNPEKEPQTASQRNNLVTLRIPEIPGR